MRKALSLAAAGLGALTIAGAALAGSRDTHMLRVPLPDGSVAQVEYVGSVPPKVTVSPAVPAFTPFGMLDRSAFDMERQMDAIMQQISSMARAPLAGTGAHVAAYGNAPPGSSSVTIVTTSNGSKTCTRRTEVDSLGPGKAPKVVSSLSGDCAGGTAAPAPQRNPA